MDFKLPKKLMSEIVDTIQTKDMVLNMISNILLSPGVFAFIAVLVIGIILVVLALQFFYRIALVAILYIVGPIAIVTKINDTYNFFDFWLKQFISAFLTLALQLIATAIGLQRFLRDRSTLVIRPIYLSEQHFLFSL
ncbi:conjugal transfer protein TrbL family protein [Geobacillus thermodenitrificans]|uniref:conjugal transfer protein TrbL family protein n=1 Tax=Geobacillus thermodenitrificans TaxID=33940 RepID=UPI001EEF2D21|nr:conjugal transfer protein TrbL family protein [Geobacillus thermodenitrificans]